jgi:hypothetical protein
LYFITTQGVACQCHQRKARRSGKSFAEQYHLCFCCTMICLSTNSKRSFCSTPLMMKTVSLDPIKSDSALNHSIQMRRRLNQNGHQIILVKSPLIPVTSIYNRHFSRIRAQAQRRGATLKSLHPEVVGEAPKQYLQSSTAGLTT